MSCRVSTPDVCLLTTSDVCLLTTPDVCRRVQRSSRDYTPPECKCGEKADMWREMSDKSALLPFDLIILVAS